MPTAGRSTALPGLQLPTAIDTLHDVFASYANQLSAVQAVTDTITASSPLTTAQSNAIARSKVLNGDITTIMNEITTVLFARGDDRVTSQLEAGFAVRSYYEAHACLSPRRVRIRPAWMSRSTSSGPTGETSRVRARRSVRPTSWSRPGAISRAESEGQIVSGVTGPRLLPYVGPRECGRCQWAVSAALGRQPRGSRLAAAVGRREGADHALGRSRKGCAHPFTDGDDQRRIDDRVDRIRPQYGPGHERRPRRRARGRLSDPY